MEEQPAKKTFTILNFRCGNKIAPQEITAQMENSYYGNLKWLIRFMAVFGFFHWKGYSGHKLTVFQKIAVYYSGFMLLVSLLFMGKTIYVIFCCLDGPLVLNFVLVIRILMLSWIFVVFVNICVMFSACWRKSDGLHEILASNLNYKNNFSVAKGGKQGITSICSPVLVLLFSCAWLVGNQVMIWFNFVQQDEIGRMAKHITWSFVNNTGSYQYLEIFENILVLCVSGSLIGTSGFFVLMCWTLGVEFGNITLHMSKTFKEGSPNLDDIKQYQNQYQYLSRIVTKLDRVFRGYLAINIIMCIASICFDGYQIVTNDGHIVDAGTLIYWMFIFLITLLMLSSSSAYLHSMVRYLQLLKCH